MIKKDSTPNAENTDALENSDSITQTSNENQEAT